MSCRVVHETTPTALSLRETPLSSDNHGRCGFEVEQASRIKVWCDFGVLVELQSSTSLRPYLLVSQANLASVRPQPTNRMRVRLSCCVDERGSNLRSRIQDAPGSGASNQEQAGFALAQAKPSRTAWMSHAPHLIPSHPKPYHPSLSIHGSKPTDHGWALGALHRAPGAPMLQMQATGGRRERPGSAEMMQPPSSFINLIDQPGQHQARSCCNPARLPAVDDLQFAPLLVGCSLQAGPAPA